MASKIKSLLQTTALAGLVALGVGCSAQKDKNVDSRVKFFEEFTPEVAAVFETLSIGLSSAFVYSLANMFGGYLAK